ncbi:MAG TPA: glucose-6-phosphate dehydrogenase [Thermoanaerobaculia bacterium]|nr:glucose-6-phosphate dehydrogenase [Thermoanaerobaculia bacterium]
MSGRTGDAPFDMVVIGATGDLARRKLLPALYILDRHRLIAPAGRIFAVARQPVSREVFLTETGEQARQHLEPGERSDEDWTRFAERIHYLEMSATETDAYRALAGLLAGDEDCVRIFYLATPPSLYGPICRSIAAAGLVTERTRIVLEKPIGTDLESARLVNAAVGEAFAETQIYRIDHYLGKETVQNLMALRFGNALFEPMWCSQHVDHVQITVAECLGVEGRGHYYDSTGALRDMVQNHLLQLLCLTAMEPPARLDQHAIRHEKIKVLQALRPITHHQVAAKTVRGQYREGAIAGRSVVGYHAEPDVAPGSSTETFAAVKAEIDNWRWAGVPFYLRTGKRMGHQVSEIVLQFRQVPHVLFPDLGEQLQPNRLVIRLQPNEFIKLMLMVKAPGSGLVLRREFLNLNLADRPGERTLLAYERLLLDVIRGISTLFMHRDEVEAAWQWIDPILEGWRERQVRPRFYAAGTWGPAESIALVVKDDRQWYEHVV